MKDIARLDRNDGSRGRSGGVPAPEVSRSEAGSGYNQQCIRDAPATC